MLSGSIASQPCTSPCWVPTAVPVHKAGSSICTNRLRGISYVVLVPTQLCSRHARMVPSGRAERPGGLPVRAVHAQCPAGLHAPPRASLRASYGPRAVSSAHDPTEGPSGIPKSWVRGRVDPLDEFFIFYERKVPLCRR